MISNNIKCFFYYFLYLIVHKRSSLPALRFYMEYHFQYLDFSSSTQFLIRQHAAALVAILEHLSALEFVKMFEPIFSDCFRKWGSFVASATSENALTDVRFSFI